MTLASLSSAALKRLVSAVVLLSCLAVPALAGEGNPPEVDGSWCVPPPPVSEADLAAFYAKDAGSPIVTQVGEVALVEDDGSIVSFERPFDLAGRTIQFLRKGKKVTVADGGPGFKQLIGEKLDMTWRDNVYVRFPEGFEFPFFHRKWRRMIVNPNGSITFNEPDRFYIAQEPAILEFHKQERIAPFYFNLRPGEAVDDGGVYVKFLPHRVRVTWLRVPSSAHYNENTFQVTLFDTGRIAFAYGEIDAQGAIVGVTPGVPSSDVPPAVDLDDAVGIEPQAAGIYERFSIPQYENLRVLKAFYDHYQDDFDHVFVFTDFDIPRYIGTNVFGPSVPGTGVGDSTSLNGLPRLGGVTGMRSLDSYPDGDLTEPFNYRVYSPLATAAHELAHKWLAYVRFIDADGKESGELLTPYPAHWSFFFNSGSSVMFGNTWIDNGDGTFSYEERDRVFGPLDQYLMGLRPASDVGELFLLTDANTDEWDDGQEFDWRFFVAGWDGLTLPATRVDITVDDIIAAVGEREPPYGESPTTFSVAFVLLSLPGEPPSAASVEKIDRFRRELGDFFSRATEGRGQLSTVLVPR